MYFGRDFDDAQASELEPFGIDFKDEALANGETLVAIASAIAVVMGSDPAASSRLSGAPFISGTVGIQALTGLLPNVKYKVTMTVTTSNAGRQITLYAFCWGRN